MSFLILGVRVWIWLWLGFVLSCGLFLVICLNREKLLGAYYKFRFPEKTIKVILHYTNNLYKVYWRLIPKGDLYSKKVDSSDYIYNKDVINKDWDLFSLGKKKPEIVAFDNIFIEQKKDKRVIHLGDGKEYTFLEKFAVKDKKSKYPEIHYFAGSPIPILFDASEHEIKVQSDMFDKAIDNKVMTELLTLKTKVKLLTMLLALVVLTFITNLFIVAKMMGWIE